MPNTFFGLTIGKTGLYAYNAAMNTSAHNSANIDTPGYTRQRVLRSAENPLSLGTHYGMVGSGIVVNSIESVRDAYFDSKYRYNNAIYKHYDTKSYYMDSIQTYFSEVNAKGVTGAMDDFFAALSGLEGDAGNPTKRTEAGTAGRTFAESLNYLYDSLQRTQLEINQEIRTIVEQINSYAEEISNLTKQINAVEVSGENANDLRDKREHIVDLLSEFANVTSEEVSGEGTTNQFIVKIDGATLVDTYEYYTIELKASETKVNENDVDGLYLLEWSNGQRFGSYSKTLGGKLQALFDLRDGNNDKIFNGKIEEFREDPDNPGPLSQIVVTGSNINSMSELNIPSEEGVITIGNKEFEYTKFDVEYIGVDPDTGEDQYQYIFTLKEPVAKDYADQNKGKDIRIGREIAYRGIPYYMAQINEFTRTFAMRFNELHRQGKDAYGKRGDFNFFTGTEKGTGVEFEYSKGGRLSAGDKGEEFSYYRLNAGNIKVLDELSEDPKKMEFSASKDEAEDKKEDSGIEDAGILKQLVGLQKDVDMFKQGTPNAFFESFMAVLGVSGQEADAFLDRQEAIIHAVEQQRYSASGVDLDEEANDMVTFQGAYNLCCRVIAVMNEIYSKLINETGV